MSAVKVRIRCFESNAGHVFLLRDGELCAYRVDDTGGTFADDVASMSMGEHLTHWNCEMVPRSDTEQMEEIANAEDGSLTLFVKSAGISGMDYLDPPFCANCDVAFDPQDAEGSRDFCSPTCKREHGEAFVSGEDSVGF